MKTYTTLLVTICGVMVSFAQNITIKGRVVDEVNKPLPFATVVLGEGQTAVQTNENGEFKLNNVQKGKHTMKASFVRQNKRTEEIRFDIVAISIRKSLPEIEHIERAFYWF